MSVQKYAIRYSVVKINANAGVVVYIDRERGMCGLAKVVDTDVVNLTLIGMDPGGFAVPAEEGPLLDLHQSLHQGPRVLLLQLHHRRHIPV